MLVLPWYIRFGIDCVIIATPFLYLHSKIIYKINRSSNNTFILIFSKQKKIRQKIM